MRHLYYNGAQGAMLVYDVSRIPTFDHISSFWFPDLQKFLDVDNIDFPIVLISNKNDLEMKRVEKEKADDLAKKINSIKFIETSAKTGDNVDNAFHQMAEYLVNQLKKKSS